MIAVPDKATDLRFSVQLLGTTGKVFIRGASLALVEPDPCMVLFSKVLLFVWLLVGLWCLWPLFFVRRGYAVFLLGSGVFLLMLMPSSYKSTLLSWFFSNMTLIEPWDVFTDVSMFGHFLAYAVFSLFCFTLFWQRFWLVFFVLLNLAVISEILQNFSLGRHARLEDVVVNLSGVLLATVFYGLVFLFLRLIKK